MQFTFSWLCLEQITFSESENVARTAHDPPNSIGRDVLAEYKKLSSGVLW